MITKISSFQKGYSQFTNFEFSLFPRGIENESPVQVRFTFDTSARIPEMDYTSDMLFICRYQINPQIAIPGSIGGTQRYIGYLEKCYSEISYLAGPPSPTMAGVASAAYIGYDTQAYSPERLYGSKMRTGTKSELFGTELWEKI